MLRSAALLIPLLSVACAAPAAQKMSFADAHLLKVAAAAVPPRAEPVKAEKKKKKKKAKKGEVKPSLELQAALIAFGNRSRINRGAVPRGSPMPASQLENWEAVLESMDGFLARPTDEISSFDVIRARVTLEAELELDARRYRQVSPAISDQVLHRVNNLGLKMAVLRRLKTKARALQRPSYEWPVSPVAVTSLFGRRLHPISLQYRQHAGIDLHADRNQLISAAGKGTVMRAGMAGGHGNLVEILHADGAITRYSHLSQILVEPGLVVNKGAPVGLAGKTGMATGVHLHFEFWRGGRPVDPLEELGQPEAHNTPLAAL